MDRFQIHTPEFLGPRLALIVILITPFAGIRSYERGLWFSGHGMDEPRHIYRYKYHMYLPNVINTEIEDKVCEHQAPKAPPYENRIPPPL